MKGLKRIPMTQIKVQFSPYPVILSLNIFTNPVKRVTLLILITNSYSRVVSGALEKSYVN